jgi:hypothetical protein
MLESFNPPITALPGFELLLLSNARRLAEETRYYATAQHQLTRDNDKVRHHSSMSQSCL